MNNRVVLKEVEQGFRMPNPQTTGGGHIVCPEELYNIMLECWDARPEARPTFQHLNDVFDNWSVSTESQYLDGQNAWGVDVVGTILEKTLPQKWLPTKNSAPFYNIFRSNFFCQPCWEHKAWQVSERNVKVRQNMKQRRTHNCLCVGTRVPTDFLRRLNL